MLLPRTTRHKARPIPVGALHRLTRTCCLW